MVSKKLSEEKVAIVPVAHDFLREDLNELRDKLNEVIEVINSL